MDELLDQHFDRARQKAFLHHLAAVLRRRPDDLIPYHEIRRRLSPERESYRGFQVVPVDQIVGSVDRFRDFDHEFLPRHSYTAGRWKSVDRAYHEDIRLPPIQLYKVGDVYFVKDGNHRVSVAREHGVEFIDAEVIEAHVRAPMNASMSAFELLLQVEYAEFLRLTDLDRTAPDHDIRPTALGRYEEIWADILLHQQWLAEQRGMQVPVADAAKDWYCEVYLPIVEIARAEGVIERVPDRSEADVYLWVMAHREALEESVGHEVDPTSTAKDLARKVEREQKLGRRLTRLPRVIRKKMRPRLHRPGRPPSP
jgi:hypothetical protein